MGWKGEGMIKHIMALFGYVKIPLQVVQISIMQEEILKEIIDCLSSEKDRLEFSKRLEAQKAMTNFLRTGRLLYR